MSNKISNTADKQAQAEQQMENSTPIFGLRHPFHAPILKREALNGEGSTKETYHIELSLEGSGIEYHPGDSCGVFAHNATELIEEVLQITKLDASELVAIENEAMTLHEALSHRLELSNVAVDVLRKYAALAKNEALDALIADREQLKEYIYGRDIVDVLTEYPMEISAQDLTSTLKKMRPRLYSIASSTLVHPNEVHLTVVALRYTANGRDKAGVCSSFLADRIFDQTTVPIFIQKSAHFRVPADHTKGMIMIGSGTGIAPFRAFIEERSATKAEGKNWLIFGNPHSKTDYLYENELKAYQAAGVLTTIDTAFSRDQAEKVYVQDKVRSNSAEIYKWLQEGAGIYICGSRDNLGQSLRDAFAYVLVTEGGLTQAEAEEQVKTWKKEKRYHEDIY